MMARLFTSNNVISVLIFLLPVTVLTVNDAESGILTILEIWGIYILIKYRPKLLQWDRAILPILLAFAAVFVVDVLSYSLADYHARNIGALEGGFRFLMFIPVFALLLHYEFDFRSLKWGVIVGGIIIGIVAIVQHFNPEAPYLERAHGSTHPIIFGDIALVLAAINLIYILDNSKRLRLFHVVGMMLALTAMVLSATRGAWLAVPVLGTLFIIVKWHEVSKIKLVASVLAAMLAVGVVYSVPQTGVKQRVDRTIKHLKMYNDSAINSGLRATSVGIRLEIWQAAWTMFKQHPILGVGTRNYRSEAIKQADAGLRNKAITLPGLNHAHNDYLWFMAEKGVLGLAVVLAVYLIPFSYFYRQYRARHDVYNLAGMAVIAAFMVMSLTECLFARNPPKTFYILSMAILLALSLKTKSQNEAT